MATPADAIDLKQGCAPWMRAAHVVVTLLAAGAVFSSTASVPVRAALLVVVLGVHFVSARRMRQTAGEVPRVRVFEDGTAALLLENGAAPAALDGPAWTSRWFSVFPLRRLDGGRPLYCTVCRSLNTGGAYRRLRILLRLRAGTTAGGGAGWL